MTTARLFLSYGRRDAAALADRLGADLRRRGYEVWIDRHEIRVGRAWEEQVRDGLRRSDLVIAMLSPHAVRARASGAETDGTCLDEISYARFSHPGKVVPVMAVTCEPPLCLFRLHFVDFRGALDDPHLYRERLDELLVLLPEALAGRFSYRSWDATLHPDDFASLLAAKRRGFVGREWLTAEIMDWVHRGDEPALLVTGDPGIGKSALVADLVNRDPENRIVAYYCCSSDTPSTLQPHRFVRTLAAMIAARLPAYAAVLDEPRIARVLAEPVALCDAANALHEGILDPLQDLPPPADGRRSILLDALDEALAPPAIGASGGTIPDLLSHAAGRLPAWLCVVATSRPDPRILERLEPIRCLHLSATDERHCEDVAAFIAGRLAEPSLTDAARASIDAGVALRERSAGNFQYAATVLDGIARGRYRIGDVGRLPPGLPGLYREGFRRLFTDSADYAPAAAILAVVLAAREPLDEGTLAAASGLGASEFHRARARLESVLPCRDGRFSFYHHSFADWLVEPRATHEFRVDVADGHARLAVRGWFELQSNELSAYATANLALHLAAAERWPDLLRALNDDRLRCFERWVERGFLEEGLHCLEPLVGWVEGSEHAASLPALATQVARIHNRLGNPEEAERWLRAAVEHGGRATIVRAVALHELGSAFLPRDAGQAMRCYREARRIAHRIGRGEEVAANLIGMATAQYLLRPRYRRIARWARQALALASSHGDLPHELEAQRLLADVSKDHLDFDGAERHVAEGLAKAVDLPFARLSLLLSKAWATYILAALDRTPPANAEAGFRAVLELATSVADRRFTADAWSGLGACSLLLGDESLAERAIAAMRSGRAAPVTTHISVRADLLEACLQHRRGRRRDAREAFGRVRVAASEARLRARETNALVGIGAACWHDGYCEEASRAWRAAAKLSRAVSPASIALTQSGIRACRADPAATPR